MVFNIEATNQLGSVTRIATDDPREAIQSIRAFEAAKFQPVAVRDERGHLLLESDILKMIDVGNAVAH